MQNETMLFERRIRGLHPFRDNYAIKQYVAAVQDHRPRDYLFCVDPTHAPVTLLIRQGDSARFVIVKPPRQ